MMILEIVGRSKRAIRYVVIFDTGMLKKIFSTISAVLSNKPTSIIKAPITDKFTQ